MANRRKNLVGKRFGRLVVVGGRTSDDHGNAYWDCVCDCGGTITTRMSSLDRGYTKSCGCRRSELASENGHNSKTHGLSQIPEYKVHKSMMDRCYDITNHTYKNYGARGISVCERWHIFSNFLEDMGQRPNDKSQIDRIDNSRGYSKENCRWTTPKVNQRNKRNNVFVLLNEKEMTIAEAAETTGLNYTTIHYRYNKGLTQETGLFSPVKR